MTALPRIAIPVRDLDADPSQELSSLRKLSTLDDIEWFSQTWHAHFSRELTLKVRAHPEELLNYWVENPTPWVFPFSKTKLVVVDSSRIVLQEHGGKLYFPEREDISVNLYLSETNFSRAYIFTSDLLRLG